MRNQANCRFFIPNHGQFDDKIDFTAHKVNHSYWFTSNEIVFDRIVNNNKPQEIIRLNFIGSNISEAKGINKLIGQNNYIKENDKSTWKTGVPNFQGVVYENLYDGIDAVFSSIAGFLKSDFIVNPNAEVNDLILSHSGTDDITINAKGELVLQTKHGEFIDGTPIAYQIINNNTEYVKAEYNLSEKGTVNFEVQSYDSDYPLIINPSSDNNDVDFGYRDSSLPVNLIEFTANLSSEGVHINWVTENEVENQAFVIERCEDPSQQWREIANYINNSELLGHGTVTYQNEYEYIDKLVLPDHSYEYRLGDVDYNSKVTYHNSLVIAVEVTDIVAIPKQFDLKPAYPNPFNPVTNIQYALPKDSYVKLSVYDISITLVTTLVNRLEQAGNKRVYWSGRDGFGKNVSGGIYLYRIEAGQFIATRKMLLLR
jgi:hypothetical protein